MKKLILLVLIFSAIALGYFEQNDGVPGIYSSDGSEKWLLWAGRDKAATLFDGSSGILFSDGNEAVVVGKFTPGDARDRLTVVGYFAGWRTVGASSSAFGARAGWYNTGNFHTSLGSFSGQYNDGIWNTSLGADAFTTFTVDTGNAQDITSVDPNDNRVGISGGHGFGANGTFKNLKASTTDTLPAGLISTTPEVWEIISSTVLECFSDSFTDEGVGTHTLTPQFIYTNSTAVGFNAEPDASHQVMLGDTNVTEVKTSGSITAGGGLTLGGNLIIPDAGFIGSVSDTDAMQIEADGTVNLSSGLTVDTDVLVVDAVADRVGIGTSGTVGKFTVGSAVGEDVYFFFDNDDVGNDTDGQSLWIYRRAAEGDRFIKLFCDQFNNQWIVGSGGFVLTGTQVSLNASGGGGISIKASVAGIRLNETAAGDVHCYDASTSGKTREFKVSGFRTGDIKRTLEIGVGIDAADTVSFDGLSNYFFDGNVGVGDIVPETLLEMTSTVPYLTLHNSTEENSDGGRESRINFKGEQGAPSAGTETTLARIQVSHDGAADDEKGKFVISVNDGDDGDTPTAAITILANGDVGIGTISPSSGLHYQGDILYLTPAAGAESNDNITIKNYATGNGAPGIILRTADIAGAYGIGVGTLSLIGGSKTTHYGGIGGGGGKISLQGGQGRDAANDPSGYAPVLLQSTGGKVGIGTDSPDSALHIKAGTSGTVGSHAAGQLIIQSPTDSVLANAVITAYESDGDGNPDQQLWYLGSSSGSNSHVTFLNRRNANLTLGTNGSTRMTILGGGNVGINTTTPDAKLQVVGDVHFGDDATNQTRFSATGDLSFAGTAGVIYGHMDVPATAVITVDTSATNNPVEVKDDGTASANDGWETGYVNGTVFAASDLHYITVTIAGTYEVIWDMSPATAAGAGTVIHGGITIDTTTFQRDNGEGHAHIFNANDNIQINGIGTVDCPNGNEEISLWISNGQNQKTVIEHGNMRIKMIGGT